MLPVMIVMLVLLFSLVAAITTVAVMVNTSIITMVFIMSTAYMTLTHTSQTAIMMTGACGTCLITTVPLPLHLHSLFFCFVPWCLFHTSDLSKGLR